MGVASNQECKYKIRVGLLYVLQKIPDYAEEALTVVRVGCKNYSVENCRWHTSKDSSSCICSNGWIQPCTIGTAALQMWVPAQLCSILPLLVHSIGGSSHAAHDVSCSLLSEILPTSWRQLDVWGFLPIPGSDWRISISALRQQPEVSHTRKLGKVSPYLY